jgi:hypothetical protein
VGGEIGRHAGREINRCFAGQCSVGRPANPGLAVGGGTGPNGYEVPRTAPMPQVVYGNRCATPVGAYFGPINPVGMPCGAMTPYGFYEGRVIF